MSSVEPPFSFRSVALAAFLPTLLFSIGEGAIIPIIPVVAHNLGAGLALAGFIAGMLMIGEVIGDVPSGWLVSRLGERMSMIWAGLLAIVGLVVALASPSSLALTIGVFLIGIATAVFALARHAFMTTYVPIRYRARALSTLGGVFRGGYFVGPFISAGVISATGNTHMVFWIHIVACLAAVVTLVVIPDPTARLGGAQRGRAQRGRAARTRTDIPVADAKMTTAQVTPGLFRTIWEYRQVLARMGLGAALVGGLRSSRTVILPLFAVAIGISGSHTALIIGIAGGVDFALFYASGQIMDRYGRFWSAVPSMAGLGLALVALGFVTNEPWFVAVAVVMSMANGLGSGILMTLGADLAPTGNPAPFLGAYRFTGDTGKALAPMFVASVTALSTLAVACFGMGAIGLVGAGLLARWIPRFIPHKPR